MNKHTLPIRSNGEKLLAQFEKHNYSMPWFITLTTEDRVYDIDVAKLKKVVDHLYGLYEKQYKNDPAK